MPPKPLPASPTALAALHDLSALQLYPEDAAPSLRAAIARRYGLDAARLICGAGSDELLSMIGRAYLAPGDEIIETQYAYSLYKIVAQQAGAVTRTARNDGFAASVDEMLKLVGPRTKIVFLDNPNNPTGSYMPFSEVRRLHAALPDDVLLVLDAAYAEFVRRNDFSAGIELAGETTNVLMTRTFSKIYGLAALRIGWAYGPEGVIDALHRVRLPFNVSAAAIAAGVAAMEDIGFMEMTSAHTEAEIDRVRTALGAVGIETAPSVANFVLTTFASEAACDAADAHLRGRGIIVRRMGVYGLNRSLRISIGTTAQNDALIAELQEFARK
jgi:histidinol-phosphate aminotransferase